jgi:hypothetical protein
MTQYINTKFFAKNQNDEFIYPYLYENYLYLFLVGNNNGVTELNRCIPLYTDNSNVSSTNYSAKLNIKVNAQTDLNFLNIGSGGGGGSGGFVHNDNPTIPLKGYYGSGGGGGSGGCIEKNVILLGENTEYIGYYLLNLGEGGISVNNDKNNDGNNGTFNRIVNNQFILQKYTSSTFFNYNVSCGFGGIGGNSNGTGVSNVYNEQNISYGGGSSTGTNWNGSTTTFYDGYNQSNVIGSSPTKITFPGDITINVCAGGSGGNSNCGFLDSSGNNYNKNSRDDLFLNNHIKANSSYTDPSFTTFGNSSITSFASYGGGGSIENPTSQSGGSFYTGFSGFGGIGGFNSGSNQPPEAYPGKTPIINVENLPSIFNKVCDGAGSGGGGGSGQPIDNTGFCANYTGSNGGNGSTGLLILWIPFSSIN